MDEESELSLAALLTQILKGEASVADIAAKTGLSEQQLHELCVQFYDEINALELQLVDNGKLSHTSKVMIGREVLVAAKYAPGHFKIVAN
jgi:hypothetical protein